MKNKLTLSAIVFAASLAPAVYASDAEQAVDGTHKPAAASGTVLDFSPIQAASAISRKVLDAIDIELRAELLDSIRESTLSLLQAVTPQPVASAATIRRELGSR